MFRCFVFLWDWIGQFLGLELWNVSQMLHSNHLCFYCDVNPFYFDFHYTILSYVIDRSWSTLRLLLVIPVTLKISLFQIIQEKVVTKKCTGLCKRNQSCMAVRTINETIPVQLKQPDGTIKCYNVQVPFDKKCKCQCTIKAEECNKKQKFDKENCACSCINQV